MTSSPFHTGALDAQRRWGKPELWTEARVGALIWDAIPGQLHARLEAAPFFFLATSHPDGRCDCSFKGGGPGLVKVLTANQVVFPHFEARVKGNGTYMSLGNLLLNPNVSMLFIDFSDGARLRVNGKVSIEDDAALRAQFPQAECAVVVDVEMVVPSCPAYIPCLTAAGSAVGDAR